VCHQTKDEMKLCRENATPSPYRNRPIEENLKLFLQMKAGVFEEGKAMLRAKIDYQSPNTTLRDPVIYRIRYTPHPHASKKKKKLKKTLINILKNFPKIKKFFVKKNF
jgi:glutaminyl-tRNA synthetase